MTKQRKMKVERTDLIILKCDGGEDMQHMAEVASRVAEKTKCDVIVLKRGQSIHKIPAQDKLGMYLNLRKSLLEGGYLDAKKDPALYPTAKSKELAEAMAAAQQQTAAPRVGGLVGLDGRPL